MADHVFISYADTDALDFTRQLADELEGGYPYINVWFDKRDIKPGRDWDFQVDDALKTCKCVLFVMTSESITEYSTCKQEWSRGLSYKKAVIPLLVHPNMQAPFRLMDRQRIDFTGIFEAGLGQLRKHLAWMDSPDGQLQAFKDRLMDAQRDLKRALPEDDPRIRQEIESLKAEIKRQQGIVDNPKAAEKRTEENIKAGLERERRPEKPLAGASFTKFINPPPGVAPDYFQDRLVETEQVILFLKNASQRLMTIVGRGGVGKTAMVCRLLKYIENGALPDGFEKRHDKLLVHGIVYLSEAGTHKVNFANLFADICKLLPADVSAKLEMLYKDPKMSADAKTQQLLEAFPVENQVILLLDNFETSIDSETLAFKDSELEEALRAILRAPQHSIKVILTTRIAPHDFNLYEAARQRMLTLDAGLEPEYAKEILRLMDEDGTVGLKGADDILLTRAVERTRGYPRALEALYAILSADRYTSLVELLELPLPENVVNALVGEAFSRLDNTAQKVMQALAIYDRPVTPAAIDFLLQPNISSINSAPVLNRLTNMHFVRRESGRYYLHPVDKEYAISKVPKKESITAENIEWKEVIRAIKESTFSQHNLTLRAAEYFAQARKPRTEWKKLDDVAAQLAEFDLRCAADDYDTAASVLLEIDFEYLLLWGHYRLTLGLYEKIYKHIDDRILRRGIIGNMGTTFYYMTQYQNALQYHSIALKMSEEEEESKLNQAIWINWIANSFLDLGKIRDAITHYELSLKLAKEVRSKVDEGHALNNLGLAYASLGDIHKAIQFYEQSLVIARDIGDRRNEGSRLGNLGSAHSNLGDSRKAIDYHEQALIIAHEIGDRSGESIELDNLGLALLDLKEYEEARKTFLKAIQIADEMPYTYIQNYGREGLAQVYLFQNDLVNSRATIEAALQYDVPQNNHNATTLHGIIVLRQRDASTARQAFTRAIVQANEILTTTPEYYSAQDAKGLALCGLAICEGKQHIPAAIETFHAARKIAPHAGVIKSVLRWFDELVKCDEEEVLKAVRRAVEGKE